MSELAERYFEKALTAVRGRDNETALTLLVEAIKLKPDFVEAWVVRGNVKHSIGDHFDALLHYDRALSVNDKLHDAWNNRGLAFADLGLFAAAEESFRKSADLMPAVEPHMGLANMYCTLGRLRDAEKEYRAACLADPGMLDAHFNLGVTLLGLGQWEEGFREYEYRWQNTPYPPRAYRNYKKWRGENLDGKRILLYPEQGYGDEIMAQRFVWSVQKKYDCMVTLLARGPMLRLTQEAWAAPSITVAAMNADLAYEADYSCPLLDVPMVLGLKPNTMMWTEHYFEASGEVGTFAEFARRMTTLPPGLNVGLCWSSGGHLNTARAAQQAKSIPLHWLKPLAMPGVNLISLQYDRREPLVDGMGIVDWMATDCHDFADTAALIENLDLVISVDTAVAHLAGAMGKPVWNFVRSSGYWPWLAADGAPTPEHSIWYPSMTLLRQPSLANWVEPIERATIRLKAMVQQRAAA